VLFFQTPAVTLSYVSVFLSPILHLVEPLLMVLSCVSPLKEWVGVHFPLRRGEGTALFSLSFSVCLPAPSSDFHLGTQYGTGPTTTSFRLRAPPACGALFSTYLYFRSHFGLTFFSRSSLDFSPSFFQRLVQLMVAIAP